MSSESSTSSSANDSHNEQLYKGSPPKAVHSYGLNKQGLWMPRGTAPLLLNRQTPFPIIFSNSYLEDNCIALKHSLAFKSAGILTPEGTVVANRGILRLIVELFEGTVLEESELHRVSKKDGVIHLGISGGGVSDQIEGFGYNFEKNMTSPVVLQDSFYVVTEMSSLLNTGTLFITCETDACDSQGRIVELKSKHRKVSIDSAVLTKEKINEDSEYDDMFHSVYYQMYFGNASILKLGIIEQYGIGRKRRPHVTSIFSWTLDEVGRKAFKKNGRRQVAEALGFVKSVIQWIVNTMATHTKYDGYLKLCSSTEISLLEEISDSHSPQVDVSSEIEKLEIPKKSLQSAQQPISLQHMDEIASELSELWSNT